MGKKVRKVFEKVADKVTDSWDRENVARDKDIKKLIREERDKKNGAR